MPVASQQCQQCEVLCSRVLITIYAYSEADGDQYQEQMKLANQLLVLTLQT